MYLHISIAILAMSMTISSCYNCTYAPVVYVEQYKSACIVCPIKAVSARIDWRARKNYNDQKSDRYIVRNGIFDLYGIGKYETYYDANDDLYRLLKINASLNDDILHECSMDGYFTDSYKLIELRVLPIASRVISVLLPYDFRCGNASSNDRVIWLELVNGTDTWIEITSIYRPGRYSCIVNYEYRHDYTVNLPPIVPMSSSATITLSDIIICIILNCISLKILDLTSCILY